MEWLLASIDSSRPHDVPMLLSWHARLMVLAWAALVPFGILAARYFKVTPRQNWPLVLDNPAWWHVHRRTQIAAAGIMALSLGLALWQGTGAAPFHRIAGFATLALAAVQIVSALLRGTKGGPTALAPDGSLRGDHYDMTARRIWFERVHKYGGLLALAFSVPTILTGLWTLNAPHWMWIVLAFWWLAGIALIVILENRVGAQNTYQAIWGPDPTLPGAKQRPVGFRIRPIRR